MKREMNRFRDKQARIARAKYQGIGGLQFAAMSPPGVGRLVRIPFYLWNSVVGFCSLIGSRGVDIDALPWISPFRITGAISSRVDPIVVTGSPAMDGVGNVAVFRTPPISWATLRIVGFETILYAPPNCNLHPLELAVADFKIGGGVNLFTHDGYAPVSMFMAGQDSFAGLREYPTLIAPNQAEVLAQTLGNNLSNRLSFGFNLVCDVLRDDVTGAHLPGAYARPGAMIRKRGIRSKAGM
jgi:hypothetical protein